MKRSRLFLLLSTALITLNGCVKDDTSLLSSVFSHEVRISGGVATRATDSGFEDGDAVGIYVVNYDGDSPGELVDMGNQADNAQYTYDGDKNAWTSLGKFYYKDDETSVDIYGFYPYDKVENVNSYAFSLAQDQSLYAEAGSLGGYEKSDFLWGKASNITPTSDAVQIEFDHKMSCVQVVLAQGDGFADGEFEQLSRSVLATSITRKSSIDLSTGVATAIGEAETQGTVMLRTAEASFRAIVVPQTVEALNPLFSITLDGIVYKFKKNEAVEYVPNCISFFTIKINKKTMTGTYELVLDDSQIIPWELDTEEYVGEGLQYYTVNVEEAGTLEATLESLNKNGSKIKNLKITGVINQLDFDYMREKMAALQALNIKEVKITAYGNNGDDEIPYNALNGKEIYYIALPDHLTKIAKWAFTRTKIIGALTIPEGVTEIGYEAFCGCNNVTSLSLPTTLVTIDDGAFASFGRDLGNLSLPYGLEYIGEGAFSGAGLANVRLILPEKLKHIGDGAFQTCGLVGDIKIPESVTTLYGHTFYNNTGLRGTLTLHDNLKFEGIADFSECCFTGELVLPAGINKIPGYTFADCLFSSIAEFPEGLTVIESCAFQDCKRLMGVLDFPETLISIGGCAFQNCHNITGLVLPSQLAVIEGGAFSNCYYINSIKCKSIQPPYIPSDWTFNAVPKMNFAVEVPERSVSAYQQANYWADFQRITANKDFSIDRGDVRYLNAGGTQEVYLKALVGAEWTVEAPDWVTVTPSSGSGKAEVTITAEPLAQGEYNRTASVVFKLTGTDYTQTTKIEQYNYEYADGDVITLKEATKPNSISYVIMGDCFDAQEIASGKYLNTMKEAAGYLMTVEPYQSYSEYFNIYCVIGHSKDSGLGTLSKPKQSRFGCQYFGSGYGIKPDFNTIFDYACKAPINDDIQHTPILVIPNTIMSAGLTYMWEDGSAVALCPLTEDAYPFDFRGVVQHEVNGHAFGKLGDEYIHTHFWIDKCQCKYSHSGELRERQQIGWYKNVSLTSDVNTVEWAHLIFHPDYANIVDVYEGGWFHTLGVWRSEPNSCMNNNVPYFSAISRQKIVERIKEYAGETFDMDEFYEKDVRFMSPTTKGGDYDVPAMLQRQPQYAPLEPQFMGKSPNYKPSK